MCKTCSDFSRDTQRTVERIPGCQCPRTKLLNDNNRYVPVAKCPCLFEGVVHEHGQSTTVGNCSTRYEMYSTRVREHPLASNGRLQASTVQMLCALFVTLKTTHT